jgi:hypothetical protein
LDEFPSPHGFARAEDYIGHEKNITFSDENCAVRYTQAGRCDVHFGSQADISLSLADVRYSPESRHSPTLL